MKQIVIWAAALGIGALLGATGYHLLGREDASENASTGNEPLYWVAPMDPSYRRDEPGKSPMGMDLVPVYANEDIDKGAVRISPAVEHNIGVRTAPVRKGRLHDALTTVAYVEYNENLLWHAYPRVEGWIEKLHVETVGEEVEAGAPLFELYSPTLVNAQEELASAIRGGNRTLIESAEERLRSLQVSDSVIERIHRGDGVSRRITMRAQQGGIVNKLEVREGHYVTPGTEVLEIAGLEEVWVTAEVFESDVAQVNIGDDVEFRFAYQPGDVRHASIDFINPVLEAMTRTLQVRATVPNPEGKLKPNMFAEAEIHVEDEAEVLLIPREAVIRTEAGDRVVLAMNEGTYKSVGVTVGRVSSDDAEVIEGLSEGDRVVTSAQFLIDSESRTGSDLQRMSAGDGSAMDHSGMDHQDMEDSGTTEAEMNAMNDGDMDHSEMDHAEMDHGQMDQGDADGGAMDPASMVWVQGEVKAVDEDARTINLTHEPIPEWNWPAMTMVMEAGAEVALEALEPGSVYRFHIMQAPDSPTGYRIMHAEPATARDDQS